MWALSRERAFQVGVPVGKVFLSIRDWQQVAVLWAAWTGSNAWTLSLIRTWPGNSGHLNNSSNDTNSRLILLPKPRSLSVSPLYFPYKFCLLLPN